MGGGRHCPLATRGFSRDHKGNKAQIEYGLVTDAEGRPVAVEVFPGNTADPTAFVSATEAVRSRFGPTPDLARRLPHLLDGHRHIVIDTPPGDVRIVRAAVEAADVVLIPTRPTLLDVDRVQATLAVTDEAGRPAAVLSARSAEAPARWRRPAGRSTRRSCRF